MVGSYDAHRAAAPISFFSSAGPTRDGRQKPEVSAPGHQVVAASARSTDGAIAMSGTSMASPAVTGLAALVLAEARAAGRSLSIEELRGIVLSAVTPAGAGGWDARYGNGRVSAREAVQAVLAAGGKRPARRVATRRRARAGAAREERRG